MHRRFFIWLVTAFTGLLVAGTAWAAPPMGASARPMATESVLEGNSGTFSLELGYTYQETKEETTLPTTQSSSSSNSALSSQALPMLLRFQALPILEVRAGATPYLEQANNQDRTDMEFGALATVLPNSPVAPGIGIFARSVGTITDSTSEKPFGNLDLRLVISEDLLGLLLLDLNVGYWFVIAPESSCVLGTTTTCHTPSQSFVPLLFATRLPLFGVLSIFGEVEGFMNVSESDQSIWNTRFGAQVHLGESWSFDAGVSLGMSDAAPTTGVSAGLRWDFLDLY